MMNELAKEIHEWAIGKGFYDRDTSENISFASEKLLLIISEVVEAQSAMLDGHIVLEHEEIADTIIRILDYCAWRGIDIDSEVSMKMKRNQNRERLHGRKF